MVDPSMLISFILFTVCFASSHRDLVSVLFDSFNILGSISGMKVFISDLAI